MTKFSYDLTIEAATEAEADSKMSAIGTLLKKLTTKEFLKLADIVKNDPVKTALAKKALGV
ncbi:MAG: hypothetical protein PSX36_10490 [bacterium]|jgi:hypothetical protein|nr:hypothetical protein [bacterium]